MGDRRALLSADTRSNSAFRSHSSTRATLTMNIHSKYIIYYNELPFGFNCVSFGRFCIVYDEHSIYTVYIIIMFSVASNDVESWLLFERANAYMCGLRVYSSDDSFINTEHV